MMSDCLMSKSLIDSCLSDRIDVSPYLANDYSSHDLIGSRGGGGNLCFMLFVLFERCVVMGISTLISVHMHP